MEQRHLVRTAALMALMLAPVAGHSVAAQAPQDRGVQVGVPLGGEADQARDRQRQQEAEQRRARLAALPIPRRADGRVVIGQTPTEKGVWTPGPVVGNPLGLKAIPYRPWAAAVAEDRRRNQLEPHTRCKPSGAARVFLTPYGVEIVEIPELARVYIFDIGGPHAFRTIYTDGRGHPKQALPDYYGHSIGWWEGDTLVVETVNFNEGFWLDRGQLPHTERLRTLERFTRTAFTTMEYELTIDDPGAYTAPITGRMTLRWEENTELFEFMCQQANYADSLMVGEMQSVDRTVMTVP